MQNISPFSLTDIAPHDIIAAMTITEAGGYEQSRFILAETFGMQAYLLIEGSHCSCYGFDEAEWTATKYKSDELIAVLTGWLTKGTGMEHKFAAFVLENRMIE